MIFKTNNIKVDNAVILAAGFGSRFVPITFDMPKGLIPVNGKSMLEQQIEQLHHVGITDITIVVGYLAEKFEYLVTKYGVRLIFNPEYNTKNSLSSVYCARKHFKNTYLLVSDNLLTKNIFNAYENKSWYCTAYMSGNTDEWCLDTDNSGRILSVSIGGHDSYVMYGPAFFTEEDSKKLITLTEKYYADAGTEHFYWEQIVVDTPLELSLYMHPQNNGVVYEFENLEELRLYDEHYKHNSNNSSLNSISAFFKVPEYMITDIRCLESGYENQAFSFMVLDMSYIGIIKHSESSSINISLENLIFTDKVTGFRILKVL
jgi:CTP:phosphocholine cytidylyltransferase involved in choline phosphorylation for cell surface LPS epitopes